MIEKANELTGHLTVSGFCDVGILPTLRTKMECLCASCFTGYLTPDRNTTVRALLLAVG